MERACAVIDPDLTSSLKNLMSLCHWPKTVILRSSGKYWERAARLILYETGKTNCGGPLIPIGGQTATLYGPE